MLTAVCCSAGLFVIPLVGGFFGGAEAYAQTSYRMQSSVMGAAGAPGQSANYRANGTLGQPTPIGIGAASDETLYAGFWGRLWIPTGTDETPAQYRTMLYPNFPNPFNPVTTIEYSLARAERVEIAVFDVNGRRLATLVDERKVAGRYRETWNGRNAGGRQVASGIYFCRMRTDSKTMVNKMILLR